MNTSQIESLVGTWFVDGMSFGEEGILVITKEGRVVQFSTSVTPPEQYPIHRLWMSADVDDHVRFSASPKKPGWLRRIEWNESGWTMIAIQDQIECRFRCRSASPASLPSWFPMLLHKSLLWMSEYESRQEAEH